MNGIREKKDKIVRYERSLKDNNGYSNNNQNAFDKEYFPKNRRSDSFEERITVENYRAEKNKQNQTNFNFDRRDESRQDFNEQAVYVSQYNDVSVAPKKKISFKAKLLVAVYIAIIAIVTTLILVNGIPSANAQSEFKDSTPEIVFSQDALNTGIDSSGNTSNIELLPTAEEYKYDQKTNWFDRFCDWIENLVG